MVDYKLVIVDKLEKERWGKIMYCDIKVISFFCYEFDCYWKKKKLMKYLFYNEGNLEGVKIEVWGIVFSLNKIVIVFNLFFLSV